MASEEPRLKRRRLEEGEAGEQISPLLSLDMSRINGLVQKVVSEAIEPATNKLLPSRLKGEVKIASCDLGKVTPNLSSATVRRRDDQTVVLDLGIDASLEVQVSVEAFRISLGIDRATFRGSLSLAFRDDLAGMEFYFVNPPEIDYHLTGLARCVQCPGLRSIIHSALMEVICSKLVIPARQVADFKSEDEIDMVDLSSPDPLGALQLTLHSGKGLVAADISYFGFGPGTSDPYVTIRLGQATWRSPTVNRNLDPVWTEGNSTSFLVYEMAQLVQCLVYDEDRFKQDDFIGSGAVSVEDMLRGPASANVNIPLVLKGESAGSITMSATWFAPRALEAAAASSSNGTPMAHHFRDGKDRFVTGVGGLPPQTKLPLIVKLEIDKELSTSSAASRTSCRSLDAAKEIEEICRRLARRSLSMGVIADTLELEASAVGIILAGESGDESARLASRKAARALPGVADFDQVLKLLVPWRRCGERASLVLQDKVGVEIGRFTTDTLDRLTTSSDHDETFHLASGLLLHARFRMLWLKKK
eukprot:CAMPEP_0170653700 /NCGR_PEP_ID=MMETSP0224-20130122/47541_1 /TAXON_ID=285029 /ORGANISM="Togula jolla, Strain CCCM 725" /LENGTH=531 /DNA_ID=CAMNT_0010985577 /DNA_START=31 /DNA_END=1626 /DNA_ORIENTATION=+